MAISTRPSGVPVDAGAVERLRRQLAGTLVMPRDPDFERARQVWNARVDRRPALIVRAARADDVAATVRFAAESGLPLAVRSGGHSPAGHGTADGAVVLDLAGLRDLAIDAERRLAWAGPGLTAGEYTDAAHTHGLATPLGDTATVGLGGLTLGGGVGYLVRRHGLTIDNLVSAEVVMADGTARTASAEQESDLFWALRGGGGNFGVVTRFQYRLHEVDTVYGGMLMLPATVDVVRGFLQAAWDAPDDLTTIAFVTVAPPLPFVPAEAHGQLVLGVLACHAGDPGRGEATLAPFRSLAQPIADMLGPMPYPALLRMFEAGPEPERLGSVSRGLFVDALDDAAIGTVLDNMRTSPSPMAMTQIRVLGGALARVPEEATAFGHRSRRIGLFIVATLMPPVPDEATIAWVDAYFDVLRPRTTGAFVSFLEDEGEERVRSAYPPPTWERLTRIKRRYDPENLFRLNQNIPPAP